MKRYLVFGGDAYYPGGGFHDFLGATASVEEALVLLKAGKECVAYDWAHVIDTQGWQAVPGVYDREAAAVNEQIGS